jgi:hypothetical protein
VMEASVDARGHLDRSAAPLFQDRWVGPRPTFLGAIWPARAPDFIPIETPLSRSLGDAPPILWSGTWKPPGGFQLEGIWNGLDATIKRFLELIPLDPPTDR